MPVWAQPGPGGGYGLNVEKTLPPLNLAQAEAAAIATAQAATRAMPFVDAGRQALNKLSGVMAAAPRDAASRLVSEIRVPQGPEELGASASELIQHALIESVAVDLLAHQDVADHRGGRMLVRIDNLGQLLADRAAKPRPVVVHHVMSSV